MTDDLIFNDAEIEEIERRLKRKLGLIKLFATLGDSDDLQTSVVDEPGQPGIVRVRIENDDVPFRRVKSGLLGAYSPYAGCPVILGYDEKDDLEIIKADHDALREANVNPLVFNSGDSRISGFGQTDSLLPLLSGAVGTANTPSTEIFVNPYRYVDSSNTVHYFEGAQIDVTASIPSADNHRYLAIFLKADDTLETTTSTTKDTVLPLGETDKQECFDSRSLGSHPVALWRLHDAQTNITNADRIEDLRGWIDTPNKADGAWNGTALVNFDLTVSEAAGVITGTLEKTGTGDIPVLFSTGQFTIDTTPAATVTLTAGTASVPQINHVYIPIDTKLMTAKTSTYLTDWPSIEHVPIAIVILRTAALTSSDGALGNQNINNRPENEASNNQGWIQIAGNNIRSQGPKWATGVTPTITIVTNGGAADNVFLATTSGIVRQFNNQTFAALDMQTGDDIHIVNDSVNPYDTQTDLNTQLLDSAGVSMSNKYFWLTFWGVINKSGEVSHLMCNLPSGSYTTLANATADVDATKNRDIPVDFGNTGFLIAETLFRHQSAASGTWTEQVTNTLLGITGGSGGGAIVDPITSFSDANFDWFNSTDPTKIVDVDLSGLTTATTRTVTMPDKDGTMAMLSDIGAGGADSPITVKNTSGAAVVANDVGYIDAAGEYKETTTANDDVAWCIVTTGGANNADIEVARAGRQTAILNANCSIGDYLITSTTAGQGGVSTTMRPEIFGVFITANGAGAGGTADVLLLTNTIFRPIASSNDLLRIDNHSGSLFSALINGAPGANTVVYDTVTGNENSIVPTVSTHLMQMVLHNTTRGDSALISAVNTGTNTITVDSVPGAWANNDAIQVNSLTNTQTIGGFKYFDWQVVSSEIPTLTRALAYSALFLDTGGAGNMERWHPFESYASAKETVIFGQVANQNNSGYNVTPLINGTFTLWCRASGAATKIDRATILGAYIAAP